MAPTTNFKKVAAINTNKIIKIVSFMFRTPLVEYWMKVDNFDIGKES